MVPIVEDVWGGGDFMAIQYAQKNASNTDQRQEMFVIKIDFEDDGADPPVYSSYDAAGFKIELDGNHTKTGDPGGVYISSEDKFYTFFSFRGRLATIIFQTDDNTVDSVYEVAESEEQVDVRSVEYNSDTGLIYVMVQWGSNGVIYSIIKDSFPEIQFATQLSSTSISTYNYIAITGDVMFIGGSLSSGTAGFFVKTTKFMNDTMDGLTFTDLSETFTVEGTYDVFEWWTDYITTENSSPTATGTDSIAETSKEL